MQISYNAIERTLTVEGHSRLGLEVVGLISGREIEQPCKRAPTKLHVQDVAFDPNAGTRFYQRGKPLQIIKAVTWEFGQDESVVDAMDEILGSLRNALRIAPAQLAAQDKAAASGLFRAKGDSQVAAPAHLE